MYKNKIVIALSACLFALQVSPAFAYDTAPWTLTAKHVAFAIQYDYHEGDIEKAKELYPDVDGLTGTDFREDGSEYECPATYADDHAKLFDSYSLSQRNVTFKVNGSENHNYTKCVLYNDRLLVPLDVFGEVGCDVDWNGDTYVATVSKDDTVLEILPYLIGMRKNKQDGIYVPLEVCARFIDDIVYVPVRAVANEFGLNVDWNEADRVVSLDNFNN